MDFKQLDRGEMIAGVGGLLLAISIFLGWYSLGNSNAVLNSCHGPNSSCSGWSFADDPPLPVAAGGARARDPGVHHRPRPRAVVAAGRAHGGDRAGGADLHPVPRRDRQARLSVGRDQLDIGWFVALIGGLLILAGSIWRSREPAAPPQATGRAVSGSEGSPRPDRNLALVVRVTEAAALAAARMVGRGDKEGADQAAVDGMRHVLDSVSMDGVVVIGEGEKDEAPMLYNGEQIGNGTPPQVDIAVDPLEGTRLTALGMPSAIAVIALSERGTMFDPGPCVYMEKIAGGPELADLLDLDRPLPETLKLIAERKGTDIRDVMVVMLDRSATTKRCAKSARRARGPADPGRRRVGGDAGGVRELVGRPAVGDRRDARGRDLGRGDQVHRRADAGPSVAAQRRRARGRGRGRL